jgi:hypothetical protein
MEAKDGIGGESPWALAGERPNEIFRKSVEVQ